MKKYFYYLVLSFVLFSCSKEEKKSLGLNDPDIQNIIEFQDTKNVKELIKYFVHPTLQLRERACMAFGSIQDSSALTSLYTMLEEDESIAQAAAYAVGQTGKSSSLPVLKRLLTRSMNEKTRFEFFVAIGKCGAIDENYYLISNYNVGKDARGTAWALFYLARNKSLSNAGVDLAIKILQNESDAEVRLGAAQAILRSGLDMPWEAIIPLFMENEDDDVKIALAGGLKGIDIQSVTPALMDNAKQSSLNCQINFVRSISHLNDKILVDYCSEIVNSSSNINLKIVAAEYLASYPENARLFLVDTDLDSLNWRVRSILLKAVLSIEDDEWMNYALSNYEETSNLYEKSELLLALAPVLNDKEWLMKEISDNDSIVATYAMEAIFNAISVESDDEKMEYIPFLLSSLASVNDAVISLSAGILRDSVFNTASIIESLNTQQAKLNLPKQTEAYLEIEKTIIFFSGIGEIENPNPFNHPIIKDSLAYLESIKGFLVKTTKGDIMMETKAFEAPGTLMSIARLVDNGYYNGKLFHRVVPNFVIQTGCPNGDGWGSQDYTMRSEFTRLRYSRGAVGMASAGKDTESGQWFISHTPTPHLNGRYTIFAYVSSGMDVVQTMEVGDRITEMSIVYKQ